ncbi:MAG: acyl-CoA thioesterase II [Deltaproteobacteria bacterium]|nr:acyl-CoA thioesterase II [Deltaproteobacteria bacterium]
MSKILDELLEIFDLSKSDEDSWTGQNQDLGYVRLFGGQVLGQALVAAKRTVENWLPHSLHAYFLRPGDPSVPVRYQVHRIRNGRSFATRRVVALQHERAIFNMSASFQVIESGFEHQSTMPVVKGPEGIKSELERARESQERLPDALKDYLLRDRPVEIRNPNPVSYFHPEKRAAVNQSWVRTVATMPDDPVIHYCMLAYISDMNLIEACMMPHAVNLLQKNMQIASLDHSMWFHQPFRVDEWLLYHSHSPVASGSRGLNFGSFYRQDGTLVASTAQEGLIRQRER